MRRSWVQDPKTGKLIPKDEYQEFRGEAPVVLEDIQPFVSHVDGTVIASRRDLREHNRRNNVEIAEFDTAAIQVRQREREALFKGGSFDRARRFEALKFAWEVNRGNRTRAERREMAERYRDQNS